MKVIWHGQVIAETNQTIELDRYHYFPPASVRMEFLQSAPKTEADRRCPHSVQFFNITDGSRRSERSAMTLKHRFTQRVLGPDKHLDKHVAAITR